MMMMIMKPSTILVTLFVNIGLLNPPPFDNNNDYNDNDNDNEDDDCNT